MTNGARDDRPAEIGGETGLRGHFDRCGLDQAIIVVADIVVELETVAFTGNRHVVVAVETQFYRAPQFAGGNRGDAGKDRGLRLLATETTAHAAHFDHHLVEVDAERVGDNLLHFGRMLGRAPQVQTAVLFRRDVGYLPFQVKLLLPANRNFTLEAARRGFEFARGVATAQMHRR